MVAQADKEPYGAGWVRGLRPPRLPRLPGSYDRKRSASITWTSAPPWRAKVGH